MLAKGLFCYALGVGYADLLQVLGTPLGNFYIGSFMSMWVVSGLVCWVVVNVPAVAWVSGSLYFCFSVVSSTGCHALSCSLVFLVLIYNSLVDLCLGSK